MKNKLLSTNDKERSDFHLIKINIHNFWHYIIKFNCLISLQISANTLTRLRINTIDHGMQKTFSTPLAD